MGVDQSEGPDVLGHAPRGYLVSAEDRGGEPREQVCSLFCASLSATPIAGEETGVDVLPDPNLLRQELPNPLPKPAALRQAFDELRAAQFPGATFKTLHGDI